MIESRAQEMDENGRANESFFTYHRERHLDRSWYGIDYIRMWMITNVVKVSTCCFVLTDIGVYR
jgi:hypothetical protein